MARSLTFYANVTDVADEIRNNDAFGELINELAEKDYDYIGQSNDELTDEAKKFIKKLAKEIDEMEEKT